MADTHCKYSPEACFALRSPNLRYVQYRARKLGLPRPSLNPFAKRRTEPSNYSAPAPAPGGIQGWIRDKIDSIRGGGRGRTAGGAYEGYGAGAGRDSYNQRRGFGPLDPDEAWDARVGNETGGYGYEEQELGLQDPSHGPYGGGGYGDVGVGGYEEGRGRSRSRQRELDERYDEETHGGGQQRLNPFGDNAEASSMRTVSPRPDGGQRAPSSHKRGQSSLHSTGGHDDSPTERRSMFREDV